MVGFDCVNKSVKVSAVASCQGIGISNCLLHRYRINIQLCFQTKFWQIVVHVLRGIASDDYSVDLTATLMIRTYRKFF